MGKARARHKTRNITITGVSEILQKLDRADAKIEETLVNALKKGTIPMYNEMHTFISQHRYSGATEESEVQEFEIKNGKVHARVGFSVRKGGIAAIFLNVGTPRIAPTFFIDKAIGNNETYLNKVIIDELTKLLERS